MNALGRLVRLAAGIWLGCAATACLETPDTAPGFEGCLRFECHGKVEKIHHGGDPIACVSCHGGDPDAITKEAAHPTVTVSFNPSVPGLALEGGLLLGEEGYGAGLAELDAIDPAILKFLNPSDYRVARETCGSATLGPAGCHTLIVDTSVLSTHATLAGQLAGGLYFGGLTDKDAIYAVRALADPNFFVTDPPDGFIESLDLLPTDATEMPYGGPTERAFFAAYGQLCTECHLSRDGVPVPGKYTSSGCNACHLLTADDGRPVTADPTQLPLEMGHGAKHRLTNLITDDQCNRCHHAHLHRGLLIKGVREESEPMGDFAIGGDNRGVEDPPNVVFWPEENYVRWEGGYELYGKPYPFYIEDEDGTNDVDETPPDIHFEKGMACIDCHTVEEVHGGEAHMPVRREFETRVRCESCHGAPDDAVTRSELTGLPFEEALSLVGGRHDLNNRVIREASDYGVEGDGFLQFGKLDRKLHPVTQIADRVNPDNPRFNPRTLMGCGLHATGRDFRAMLADWVAMTDPKLVDDVFPGLPEYATLAPDVGERAGRMECFACHNAWTLNCFGCHMVKDETKEGFDIVTGDIVPYKMDTYAMSVVADALTLGFGTRGRITPMVGTSIFVSHIDPFGDPIVDAMPLRTMDGLGGDGNQHNPVHHHTIRRTPRDCTGCHPAARSEDKPADPEALPRAIGFGTGRFPFEDGEGRRHLMDRLVAIDFDGDGVWDDPETTPLGSVAMAVVPLAANTHLTCTTSTVSGVMAACAPPDGSPVALGPGPLDLDTINRMLMNPVVPQRRPR